MAKNLKSKKRLVLLSSLFALGIGVGLINANVPSCYQVNAEEIVTTTNQNEDVPQEEDTSTSTSEESVLNQYIDQYFGWIVGIPVGTVVTAIGTLLITFKKLKSIKKEGESVNDSLTNITSLVSTAKDALNESKDVTLIVTNAIKDLNQRFNSLNDTLNPLIEDLEKANKVNEELTAKVNNLESIMSLEVANDEKMIANGTANKIAEIIKSQSLPKNVKPNVEVDGVQDLIDAVAKTEEEVATTIESDK